MYFVVTFNMCLYLYRSTCEHELHIYLIYAFTVVDFYFIGKDGYTTDIVASYFLAFTISIMNASLCM